MDTATPAQKDTRKAANTARKRAGRALTMWALRKQVDACIDLHKATSRNLVHLGAIAGAVGGAGAVAVVASAAFLFYADRVTGGVPVLEDQLYRQAAP